MFWWGIFLGTTIGFLLCAALTRGKIDDLESSRRYWIKQTIDMRLEKMKDEIIEGAITADKIMDCTISTLEMNKIMDRMYKEDMSSGIQRTSDEDIRSKVHEGDRNPTGND
jgi:hypothetical protein